LPDGATHYRHYKAGYTVALPVSVMSMLLDVKFSAGYLLGYTFHRYCDNDWDLMGSSASEGRMVNELPIVGHILYGVSSSYGSTFRRFHRSWITHFPGVSTLIRLIWVFLIPFICLDAYGINFIGGGWVWFWVGLWTGLSQADGIHWWLDKTRRDK
jgi:hypothetical protein